jgi:hydrogenase/urease accessory protein HupE
VRIPRAPLSYRVVAITIFASLVLTSSSARAHLLVDNAMDVVVGRDTLSVDVRISMDQVTVVEAHGVPIPPEILQVMVDSHRAYVLSHLHFRADDVDLVADALPDGATPGVIAEQSNSSLMASYKIVYPLEAQPALVQIAQDCLREDLPSEASFTIRIRQNDDPVFKTMQLHRDEHVDFDCRWKEVPSPSVPATSSRVDFWATASAFLKQGIWHILTGYDHLLFVSGLVLAAGSLWDLIKVVFAFTLAHTITLTLCVLNIVNLSSRVVEPMISLSIMLVALQNIFRPKESTGWARMGIAFGFGLFHGLGFAGGLKDAMSELPNMALWISLISFSLGVEIGHQIVVLPLYTILRQIRKSTGHPKEPGVPDVWQTWGSWAICIAGAYYLCVALRL